MVARFQRSLYKRIRNRQAQDQCKTNPLVVRDTPYKTSSLSSSWLNKQTPPSPSKLYSLGVKTTHRSPPAPSTAWPLNGIEFSITAVLCEVIMNAAVPIEPADKKRCLGAPIISPVASVQVNYLRIFTK